jgi:hypothetical protein
MYPELPEELNSASSLRRRNITYFPVVPGRLEFASEVRRRLLERPPEVLAIELPLPLRSAYLRAIARFPEISILRFPDPIDPLQWVYVPVEPSDPFIEALRTGLELGLRIEFIEPNWGDRPHLGDAYPDTYAIQMIGRESYVNSYRLEKHEPTEEMLEYTQAMARKMQGLQPDRETLAVVSLNVLDCLLDAMELPQERPIEPRGSAYLAEVCNVHPDCLAEITVEFPFLIQRYQRHRSEEIPDLQLLDRAEAQLAVLKTADVALWRSGGARLEAWQYRQIEKFARNMAHSSGELVADVVDLTLAARGVAGDRYARQVWNALNLYPLQRADCEYPTIKVTSEEIWCRRRRIRLRDHAAHAKGGRPSEIPVVVIFEEGEEFAVRTAHENSAAYANADAECGGLLLLNDPAKQLDDIWSDPRFDAAETNAERLLLAALHHSSRRKVEHIAAKPPRRLIRDIAAHLGRTIEHVPIGQVSRSRLNQIRRAFQIARTNASIV